MRVVALPATTPTPRTVITTSCASNAVTYATCIRKDWTRSSCHARPASAIGSSTEKCSSRATAATAAGRRHCLLRQQATDVPVGELLDLSAVLVVNQHLDLLGHEPCPSAVPDCQD